MIQIKCLFWNINKKNLVQEIITIILENRIDILIVAEAENLDVPYLLSELGKHGRKFKNEEILPRQREIMVFADKETEISTYREEKYYSAYKVHENGKNRLLVAVHLVSAMYYSEQARNQRASQLAKAIEKLEESCNAEAEQQGRPNYNTIVVGDFNLHPFSTGIIGIHGFNAVMDSKRALKKARIRDGKAVKFYYNPMWNLMGKRENSLGTFYYEQDQDDNSFYWYTFDQILLRPELIDDFVWSDFGIIEHIGKCSLLKNDKIYNRKYSDHLPVKFAVS